MKQKIRIFAIGLVAVSLSLFAISQTILRVYPPGSGEYSCYGNGDYYCLKSGSGEKCFLVGPSDKCCSGTLAPAN
jgi:hypothetical protein